MVPFPDYPPEFWATAAIAVLLIGIAKGGFGGGPGLLATPLMALTIPVSEAAALLLPLLKSYRGSLLDPSLSQGV